MNPGSSIAREKGTSAELARYLPPGCLNGELFAPLGQDSDPTLGRPGNVSKFFQQS